MLYKYNDIVAVNDIHNETVGIGFIVDLSIDGSDEKYCVIRFNSGNPITINRRSIRKLYVLRGYVYEGFAYRMRNIIRHLDRGTYMTDQEFEKYQNEWLKSQGDSLPSKPYSRYAYRYDSKFMDNIWKDPKKLAIKTVSNSIYGIPPMIKMNFEGENDMLPVYIAYKKIIFNGPCTIILWTDGTKTIAKLYEDIDKFDPEKGVAICFMKKVLGHTETNKILRKATKQYADETTKSLSATPTIQETLKSIADRLSEPLISFNKEDKDDSKS